MITGENSSAPHLGEHLTLAKFTEQANDLKRLATSAIAEHDSKSLDEIAAACNQLQAKYGGYA